MTLLALLLLALGLILVPFPTALMWLVVPAILTAFGIVFIEVTTALLVSENVPNEHSGKAMGIYRSVIVIAEIVAALAGGVMSGVTPNLPFIVASLVVISGVLLVKGASRAKLKS